MSSGEAAEEVRNLAKEQADLSELQLACKAPKRHRENLEVLRPWTCPDMVADLRRCLFDKRATVALIGPRASGKTQLAVCMIYEFIRAMRLRAEYWRAGDLFNRVRDTIDMDAQSRAEVVRHFRHLGLLVIDEVQERLATPFEDTSLAALIDKRYGDRRPTILIGNLTVEGLHEHIGPSITSRMQEGGRVFVLKDMNYRDPNLGGPHLN